MVRLAHRPGFTLIELMIAVVIGAVLFSGGLAAYRGFGDRQTLKQAGATFRSNLRLFQQKALSGEKPSECLADDVFEGFEVSYVNETSYLAAPICQSAIPDGETFMLAEEVEFLGVGWDTIFFPVLRSELTGAQTITLSLSSFSYQVVIESSGVIRGEML